MADRFYVGGGAFDEGFDLGFLLFALWDDTANWSTSSGGAGGASVPGSGDVAIFDANSGSCLCDVKPNVQKLDLQSGYDHKLDFDTYGATIGSGGCVVADGELDMGSAKVDINATSAGTGFFQSGGEVTLTSDTCEVNGDFERSAGTLNHNSGTVFMLRVVAADRDLDVNGATLYNVSITYGAYGIDLDSDMTIDTGGLLKLNDLRDLAGANTITLLGDMETSETSANYGTRATVHVVGTGAQEIKGTSVTGNRIFPISGLIVDKPSGTLTFTNKIKFQSNTLVIEYIRGDCDWTGCTNFHLDGHHSTIKCTADWTIEPTQFEIHTDAFNFYISTGILTLASGCTLQGSAYGNLVSSAGGEVHLQGDANFNSDITEYPSTAKFVANGTGAQTVQGTGQVTKLVIDKPSGTLTLGSIAIGGDTSVRPQFEYIQGDVDTTGSTIEIGDGAYDSHRIKTRDLELNNLTINPQGSYNFDADGPCIVKGKLLVSSVYNFGQINGGYIDVHGDFEFNDTSTVGSDCPVNLVGDGAQSLLCDGGDLGGVELTIDKPSGTVSLGENFAPTGWTADLTVTRGELDTAGYDVVMAGRTFTLGAYGKFRAKGDETFTIGTVDCQTGSTVEFYDAAATAVVTNFTKTYYNLELGASKTHQVASGVGNGIVVNGVLKSLGTSGTRAVLRSTTPATQWELDLQGTSWLYDAADIQDGDASAGNDVYCVGSLDSGNNTADFIFSITPSASGYRPGVRRHNV